MESTKECEYQEVWLIVGPSSETSCQDEESSLNKIALYYGNIKGFSIEPSTHQMKVLLQNNSKATSLLSLVVDRNADRDILFKICESLIYGVK